MTGTAKTEENEFLNTYNMRVYEVPTNRPVARIDEPDWYLKIDTRNMKLSLHIQKNCMKRDSQS